MIAKVHSNINFNFCITITISLIWKLEETEIVIPCTDIHVTYYDGRSTAVSQ